MSEPTKPDWQKAYPTSHEAYQQQARDYVDEQHRFFKQQKQPGYIIPGYEGFVLNHLPPNDPTVLRLKWKRINGDAPYPGDEVQS